MNIIITAYSFVAAVIGAGFASGQEILTFFTVYGKCGILGMVIASLIFGGFSFTLLNICRQHKISDYNELTSIVMSKRIKKLSDILTFIFLLYEISFKTI